MLETIRRFVNRWRGSIPSPYAAPTDKIAVLAITSNDGDRRLLSNFSIRGQWDLVFTSSCQEALDILTTGRAAVIICDRDLPAPDWRECVRSLASARPECPILLMSSICDEYLWEEVVHVGGYDVATKPLLEEQVVRAVNLAWSYAKNLKAPTRL